MPGLFNKMLAQPMNALGNLALRSMNSLEAQIKNLSDEQLKAKTRIQNETR